jgi:hypothetical protein
MGVKHVEVFGDLLLVVQQIAGTFQCLDESLNVYLDKCLEIISLFDDFTVLHVSWDENTVQMIWRSKHKISNQIEEILIFWKNQIFRFAKPDDPVFNRCTVR